MMDKKGIERDFGVTPFIAVIDGNEYYFSSQSNLETFCDKVASEDTEFNIAFNKRYGINVDIATLRNVMIYRKVERRGFRIVNNAKEVMICPNQVVVIPRGIMKKR